MRLMLLAIFVAVPLVEIALFIQVGDILGLWPTLALTVATAIAGVTLLRLQGTATLLRARQQLDHGELPAKELFDAVCLVIAGGLLLIPGFFTDFVGLLLFLPPIREQLRKRLAQRLRTSHVQTRAYQNGSEVYSSRTGGSTVIDGEYSEVTETDPANDNPRASGDRIAPLPTDHRDGGHGQTRT